MATTPPTETKRYRKPAAAVPPQRSRFERLSYTFVLVILLPIIFPVWLTSLFAKSAFWDATIGFVSSGDLALASVFLAAAVLCEGTLKRKHLGLDAVITFLVALAAAPVYASARFDSLATPVNHKFDEIFWMSVGTYALASGLAATSQLGEYFWNSAK